MDYQSSKTRCVYSRLSSKRWNPSCACSSNWSAISDWWDIAACRCSNKDNCCPFCNRDDWCHSYCQDIKGIAGGYELDLLLMRYLITKNCAFPFYNSHLPIALKAQRLPLIASCSEMGSRTITAIIISGYSFVTDTLAASTTASRKFSFVHSIFLTLLVFETSEVLSYTVRGNSSSAL